MLNRQQIEAAKEPLAGIVQVDAWGGEIGIRALTVAEVKALPALAAGEDNLESLAKFVSLVLADESGKRLYEDDEADQLQRYGFKTLMTLAREAQRLNAIGEVAREEVKKK